jgi:hypothetical protein
MKDAVWPKSWTVLETVLSVAGFAVAALLSVFV